MNVIRYFNDARSNFRLRYLLITICVGKSSLTIRRFSVSLRSIINVGGGDSTTFLTVVAWIAAARSDRTVLSSPMWKCSGARVPPFTVPAACQSHRLDVVVAWSKSFYDLTHILWRCFGPGLRECLVRRWICVAFQRGLATHSDLAADVGGNDAATSGTTSAACVVFGHRRIPFALNWTFCPGLCRGLDAGRHSTDGGRDRRRIAERRRRVACTPYGRIAGIRLADDTA
jgi:hypothetical protein